MEILMTVISFTERSTGRTSTSFSEAACRWFGLQWLFDAAAAIAEHVHRQRMIAELYALDDRHLKDIGIARCEIWYRVNHPQER
jgi:uncharacterized protein YjiS (DUF1127 family)